MINLLPIEEKQKLLLEKKEKLAVIWGIIVLVSLFCLILILFSIKFYVLSEANYQKDILEQTKQKNYTSDLITSNNLIKKYNTILAQVDSFYKKEVYFNQVLKIITDVPSPDGLYFTNFLLTRDTDGSAQINILGVSDTRDDLLIFKKNIEERPEGYPGIKNPYFSPESWISPENVKFSLTFKIGPLK